MNELSRLLLKYQHEFKRVVDFDPKKETLYHFDFSKNNNELSEQDLIDTEKFSAYVNSKLSAAGAKFGIGGYDEDRVLYRRSKIFDG
ncbi:MAG TPA: hypothetical protein VKH37_10840, partial [Ferruginibacter sp.]|nr:hypothetical protein [Ferruginibacter sp.]